MQERSDLDVNLMDDSERGISEDGSGKPPICTGGHRSAQMTWFQLFVLVGVGLILLAMTYLFMPLIRGEQGWVRYALVSILSCVSLLYLVLFYTWEIRPSYGRFSILALAGYLLFYFLLSLLV